MKVFGDLSSSENRRMDFSHFFFRDCNSVAWMPPIPEKETRRIQRLSLELRRHYKLYVAEISKVPVCVNLRTSRSPATSYFKITCHVSLTVLFILIYLLKAFLLFAKYLDFLFFRLLHPHFINLNRVNFQIKVFLSLM